MKTDDADVNGIHILFLREGALQVVTALKSDEVHVIWLRVDERVDSRVGTVDSPDAYVSEVTPCYFQRYISINGCSLILGMRVGIGSFQNGNFPFWKLTGNFLKLSKPNFGGLEISSGQRKFPDFTLVYCVTAHHQVYQYTALLVLVTRDS